MTDKKLRNDRNTPLRKGLEGLKKSMTKKRKHTKNEMIKLNTKLVPGNLDVSKLDNYINIHDTLLNTSRLEPFELVFGKTISMQRAIDFAVHTKMDKEYLMTPNLKGSDVLKNNGGVKSLPNYWAFLGYLVIERISQNTSLKEIILEDKEIINAEVGDSKTFKGVVKRVVPNNKDGMYTGVVRAVVKVFRDNVDNDNDVLTEALDKVIQDLKQDKSKSVFTGIRCKTDFL